MISPTSPRVYEILRFLIAGGINTGLTWLLYLLLLIWLRYELAYALSYVAGIVVSYLISTRFVFRQRMRWRAALLFPLVYAVQFALGFLLLKLLVDRIGVPQALAPLLVIVLTLPITFLMSRWIVVARRPLEATVGDAPPSSRR